MMRFTHIQLENWRNFRRVEVNLEGRSFLVGPNASGKSNLLDAFRFLHDIVAVGGGFQQAVGSRGGVSSLRALAAREYSDIDIQVTIGNDDEETAWEYGLTFNQDNRKRPVIRQERVARLGAELWTRPIDDDRRDPERLTQTFLEQVNQNRDFREVAGFFNSVRYAHLVPQLVREPERSVGRKDDPYGGDFLEQVARTQERTQRARLRRITEALRVAVPQLSELELTRDERGFPHVRGKYEHWRPQGAWQMENQFSDGTLRLLGLLWALQDGTGPLLLEEPELSLHPDVVRFIPSLFAGVQRESGRQIVVSTQSADLLRDPGIGADEVLLLIPAAEGTTVSPAISLENVKELLAGGISLADIVIPKTRPKDAEQLSLVDFGAESGA